MIKLILEGAKTPVANKGKDPVISGNKPLKKPGLFTSLI
jgi:hypothetical protein